MVTADGPACVQLVHRRLRALQLSKEMTGKLRAIKLTDHFQ